MNTTTMAASVSIVVISCELRLFMAHHQGQECPVNLRLRRLSDLAHLGVRWLEGRSDHEDRRGHSQPKENHAPDQGRAATVRMASHQGAGIA
jgi:hypothetical protein